MSIGKNLATQEQQKPAAIRNEEQAPYGRAKLISNTAKRWISGQPSTDPDKDTFGTGKRLVFIKHDLWEKLNNYVYWTPGATKTAALNKALAKYLEGKNTKKPRK